jgi:hypothetical protein
VAIDQQSEVIYVIDRTAESLFRFDLTGSPSEFGGAAAYISGNEINGLTLFGGAGESQIAVDSETHRFYVTTANSIRAFEFDGEPAEFTAGTAIGTSAIEGFGRAVGVAVDSNGFIYASDRTAETITVFAPSGEQVTQFAVVNPANLAVDSTGAVYVNRQSETVVKFTPSTFPVTTDTIYTAAPEPVHPAATYTVAVDLATDRVFMTQTSADPRVVVYDAAGSLLATFAGLGEEGELSFAEGIALHGDSGQVFVGNAPPGGLSQVEIFGPRVFFEGHPTVAAQSVSEVTGGSATLRAKINPNTAATTYYFEYGLGDCSLGSCSRVPLDSVSIGEGHDAVTVLQEIQGLQAGTTYHFRVVAENSFGVTAPTDRTFTTQVASLSFQLADSRAWEMVSPPNKHGALLAGSAIGQIQAAADGNGLAYLSGGSIEPNPEGNRSGEASNVLARRSEAGWRSKDITPPNSRVLPLGIGLQSEYKLFTPDLSEALLEPRDGTNLSPEASERTPYLRMNTEPPSYRPLVTAKEGFANVPLGTQFGGRPDSASGNVLVQGATTDLEHVALTSFVPLTAGAPTPALYGWTAGEIEPISVLPEGEGGAMVASNTLGAGPASVRHAVSEDGSRVYWTAQASGQLYMRDVVAEESARVDVVQSGASGAGGIDPEFQGASADGTVVFFTDSQQLTEDASPSDRDLYRCEIPIQMPVGGCNSLIDLTPPVEGSGESADVQGVVSAMSNDGFRVYFVARGALEAQLNQAGQAPTPGAPNLYLWQEEAELRFIARLSEEDRADWGMPSTVPGFASAVSAASSPSGRFFAFMSERGLTGMDNLDVVTGEPVEQVFRYDAGTGGVHCVSCNPSGGAPEGRTIEDGRLIDPQSQWVGRQAAAILPEPTVIQVSGNSIYRPRAVLDTGRIFFNAASALVGADSNDQWDVYQYEDVGSGDCKGSSGSASARSGEGCVSLISSGSAVGAAAFLDASESGNDVFFLTPARLSGNDKDDEYDVYDARVGGKPAVLEPIKECLGEGCRTAPPQALDPVQSKAPFHRAGNLRKGRKCPKGKHKVRRQGRAVCIPRKHGRHQAGAGQRHGGKR